MRQLEGLNLFSNKVLSVTVIELTAISNPAISGLMMSENRALLIVALAALG